MKIFLIGFMGTGKSFTGRRLADLLGWHFLDLDDEIEKQNKKSIAKIFEKQGEARFRELEQQALHQTAAMDQAVIATGGGAPCFADNMNWMNQHGLTIYLAGTADLLSQRLAQARAHRPILSGLPKEKLADFIEKKLEEREPYYRMAAVVFGQKGDEDVAAQLFEHLPELRGQL